MDHILNLADGNYSYTRKVITYSFIFGFFSDQMGPPHGILERNREPGDMII